MTHSDLNARLFVYLPTPPDLQDPLILRLVAPLFAALKDEPRLSSMSFARTADPEPLIRILVAGEAAWIRDRARPFLEERGRDDGGRVFAESELPEFAGEIGRWGGETGLTLAERIFHRDSRACIERIELESRGPCARSRREWSLLWTEGFIDLLRFDRDERLALYRRGYRWPIERGTWGDAEIDLLESKYQRVREGLAALLRARAAGGNTVWGDAPSAAGAARGLAELAPVTADWLSAEAAGRFSADRNELVWSLTHVHALRLGIDSIAEAILRFFVFRLYEDGSLP